MSQAPTLADAGGDVVDAGLADADDQQCHSQGHDDRALQREAGAGRLAAGHGEAIRVADRRKARVTAGLVLEVVGATGFEPATSRSRTERSTKLSHAPINETPV